MKEVTTGGRVDVLELRQGLGERLRARVHGAIEAMLEEELSEALGAEHRSREETRRGYRNGARVRQITTETGESELRVPRGRLFGAEGTTEFRSELVPRYARRTRAVDEAILSCYLAGANSRRIRKALEPLLGASHLSRSSVSRVVARLKKLFGSWDTRELSSERYLVLFLDALYLKVRLARRVVSVPMLAVLGVDGEGQKRLLALRLALSEGSAHWSSLVADLGRRGLPAPVLIISDGHSGLHKAMALWSEAKVQRCTFHKRANLEKHCPAHARAEMLRDYRAIVEARDGLKARDSYQRFVAKWSTLCPPVARSLEEAGEQLLTFYEFPRTLWKGLRTTNALENLNREFRRRTKTQASFASEDAARTLLFGLVAFGQIRLRRIDGYKQLASLLDGSSAKAA